MPDKRKGGFSELMAAAAFAEAGEPETARSFLQTEGTVLLAIQEQRLDQNVLTYAANLCKRIKAGIDILWVSSCAAAPALLERYMLDLSQAGVACRLIPRNGQLGREVLDYTQANKHVLFVVIDSLESWSDGTLRHGDKSAQPWRKLACPLVVAGQESES